MCVRERGRGRGNEREGGGGRGRERERVNISKQRMHKLSHTSDNVSNLGRMTGHLSYNRYQSLQQQN